MKPLESTLAFVQACAVRPSGTTSVGAWQRAALHEHQAEQSSTYRVLTRWQFGEVGQQPDAWCAEAAVQGQLPLDTVFAADIQPDGVTPGAQASQADMAEAAVTGLLQALPAKPACGVAIYATSGVDENFFQSSLSRVMAGAGLSRVPHFGVAQWQGASWMGAMDMIDALSAQQEGVGAAMLVCAEKWPLPYPRVLSLPTVLGDGAAALWIDRVGATSEQPALVCLATKLRSHDPYVSMPDVAGQALPVVDRTRILADARALMAELLQEQDVQPGEVQAWLPSGLSADWDQALQASLGLEGLLVPGACAVAEPAWLGTAAGPVAIERLLGAMRAGQVKDGTCLLTWGLSLGGTVGVALLQARCPHVAGGLA